MPLSFIRAAAPTCAILAAALAIEPAIGCPYSIRDSAFIGRASARPYRLVVSFDASLDSDARAELASRAEAVSREILADTNIVLELVDLDGGGARSGALDLPARLREELATATSSPRAHLIAPDGRSLALGVVALEALDEARSETVSEPEDAGALKGPSGLAARPLASLARLVADSPLRSRLVERLVEDWCAVLYIAEPEIRRAKSSALERAARSLAGTPTELQKTIGEPLWLEVDPADPGERVLLFALGATEDARADVLSTSERLVVLAGRGETRGPTLEGDAITPDALKEIVATLGRSCSCTTSSDWLLGRAVPLRWRASDRSRAREALGFDPLDPEVLEKIRGEGRRRRPPLGGLEGFELGLGYEEISLEAASPGAVGAKTGVAAETEAIARVDAASTESAASLPESTRDAREPAPGGAKPDASGQPTLGRRLLWTLAVLVGALGAATAFVLAAARRTRGRRSARGLPTTFDPSAASAAADGHRSKREGEGSNR